MLLPDSFLLRRCFPPPVAGETVKGDERSEEAELPLTGSPATGTLSKAKKRTSPKVRSW